MTVKKKIEMVYPSGDEDEAKESEEDNKEEGNKGAGGEDIHMIKNSDFVDDLEEAMTDKR